MTSCASPLFCFRAVRGAGERGLLGGGLSHPSLCYNGHNGSFRWGWGPFDLAGLAGSAFLFLLTVSLASCFAILCRLFGHGWARWDRWSSPSLPSSRERSATPVLPLRFALARPCSAYPFRNATRP